MHLIMFTVNIIYDNGFTRGVFPMKHKVKVVVETKKKGLLGTKTVQEVKDVWVNGPTSRKMQKEKNNRPYTVEEMMLYDALFD